MSERGVRVYNFSAFSFLYVFESVFSFLHFWIKLHSRTYLPIGTHVVTYGFAIVLCR